MTPKIPLTEDQLIAYFEGNLPASAAAAVAAQVADDPGARSLLADWQAQNDTLAALYAPLRNEPVPARLTDVITAARAGHGPRLSGPPVWQVAASVAILVIGIVGGWIARDLSVISPQTQSLTTAAVMAHQTFVGEVKRPVEVLASDATQMNRWMSKRLGRDMRPPDLASAGFALLGGRIVPSPMGVAGLYMYENAEGQRVTLYIVPQGSAETMAFQFAQSGTTQSFSWMDNNLSCAVVGDIPRDALRGIAVSAYDQLI